MTKGLKFKRFPPITGSLLVPSTADPGTAAAIALYPACRVMSAAAQWMAYAIVRAGGGRLLPVRSESWSNPVPEGVWADIHAALNDQVGDFDAFAVHQRRPVQRSGFNLLTLRAGMPTALIKVRCSSDSSLDREAEALTAVAAAGPREFLAPLVTGQGRHGGWSYLCLSVMIDRIHRVPRGFDLSAVAMDISRCLAGFPRPAGVPTSWEALHGDFTPWNVREAGGRLIVLDWEGVGYGPALADLAWYDLVIDALRLAAPRTRVPHRAEVYRYWAEVVKDRAPGETPPPVLEALERRLVRSNSA